MATAEKDRLLQDANRSRYWKRWGPYLPDRQWGTVREDYSSDGEVWRDFPHEQAQSRTYRWGEDGLLGFCDRRGRLCFALALWNGKDPILKERLFGLSSNEGNHGEDVKEQYFYLDATPTSSYLKALYKYPQNRFPYEELLDENARRGRQDGEFELVDTKAFEKNRYFDVSVEYAKASPEDILVRITVANRGSEPALLHLLPTLWFRNVWSWGLKREGQGIHPELTRGEPGRILARHPELGERVLEIDNLEGPVVTGLDTETAIEPELLFTDNETNVRKLYGVDTGRRYVKDAFHRHVVDGEPNVVRPEPRGTKAAAWFHARVPPQKHVVLRLRLRPATEAGQPAFGSEFGRIFDRRIQEAHAFYTEVFPESMTGEERLVARQAYAGLLWSKKFYHYSVSEWLDGDPAMPAPPSSRRQGRNHTWRHFYARDVLSMPDGWEYPWFAAWDLAFHMIPMARIDPLFAKQQLLLFLREWYMHPNGQIPAYEFGLDDVNPPVHAWAAWRVYKIAAEGGRRDREFLARVFQKLLLNFTWWVNRKDSDDNNLFAGGFLGLDNIGVFDRSQGLPAGGKLEQADGTAWMAFYCGSMLSMALELAQEDRAYEDMASKFFEHFVGIIDAINHLGGSGLWDDTDGFYYDQLHVDGRTASLRVRSMVGIIPLFAAEILEEEKIAALPEFQRRMQWFLDNRSDLARHVCYVEGSQEHTHRLLAVPSRAKLERVLRYVLDEEEFLSPYGIRSLSRYHAQQPFRLKLDDTLLEVGYTPGESSSPMFGGNSNWRGPVWFPLNYLLIEALERYHHFYGESLKVECPSGSGKHMNLKQVAEDIRRRLIGIFLPNAEGQRPCHGGTAHFRDDPHWRDLLLFHEYFHGDSGRGLGASHQTGWTALISRLLETSARRRPDRSRPDVVQSR